MSNLYLVFSIIISLLNSLDLNEPTEIDCNRDKTYRVIIIVGGSVIGGIIMLAALSVLLFCCYKGYKKRQQTKRLQKMTPEEIQCTHECIMQLLKIMQEGEDKCIKKLAKELINNYSERLCGDGRNEEEQKMTTV